VRSHRRPQRAHTPRRDLLDAPNAVRLGPRLGQDERAQHASTDELERIDRLLLGRHELEVDVEERRSIERDEESRLAHVIARERRQKWAEPSRNLGPVAQNLARKLGARDHDEIEVGMLVQGPADERAPGREPDEARIGAKLRDRGLQKSPMHCRHGRPAGRVESVFVR